MPARLQAVVGQTEFVASTGARDLALARIIAGELLAQWRRRLLELDRLQLGMDLDVLRVTAGSPVLTGGASFLPLTEAAAASGIGEDSLLREAAAGRLRLFVRLRRSKGFRVPYKVLDREPGGGYVVPRPSKMHNEAIEDVLTGVVQILDAEDAATVFLAGDQWEDVLFGLPADRLRGFAPDLPVSLGRSEVEVLGAEVDSVRRRAAELVTPEQVALATSERGLRTDSGRANELRPLRDSIEQYLNDHTRPRGTEQTRRIRDACNLFLELAGKDLRGCDLSRELVRRYRDELLPSVPAKENKVRLIHKTSSVSESIRAVEGTPWPRMSPEQQVKRMGWISGWMEWLGREGWSEPGLAEGLVGGGTAGRVAATKRSQTKDQDRRDAFTDAELARIFSADWFKRGRGELTAAGTYRTWSPFKTWVPLIGLLTGARVGEIAQLQLKDIWLNEHGVWLIDVIDGSDEDADGAARSTKKLKNVNARRQIPIHSELIRLGLIEWRDTLESAGYRRLFPELKHDPEKGYGKAVTKWFSTYLRGLGMPRTGRKVFHSFRHTMASRLANDLLAPLAVTKQILGHERGDSTTVNTYRKDMEATGRESPLVRQIEAVKYDFLSDLAPLDHAAGLLAVQDALRRKSGGRGAIGD